MQSIDSTETYIYEKIKDLVIEKEEIKCSNITKWYKKLLTLMMLQKKNIKELNSNLPKNSCSSIRLLIFGGSGKQIHYLI